MVDDRRPIRRPLFRIPSSLGRLAVAPGVPLLVLSILTLVALAAPLIAPNNPIREQLIDSLLPPAWLSGGTKAHLLGTDVFGRDILSRLIYGARISLGVAALAILMSATLGTVAGVVAGFAGSWLDAVIMRIVDVLLSLPLVLVALALGAALGPSFTNVVIVIGLLIWPRIARQIRGKTLVLKRRDFVQYARVVGVPPWAIIVRHILPNVAPTLLVMATLQIGTVILLEASLSFLGAGVQPPQPSWGVMVSDGRALIATGWWIALFPGLAIAVTVLMFNTLGDWLRDHLDPSLKEI
jgi:peptide/nickel transport system permease protein